MNVRLHNGRATDGIWWRLLGEILRQMGNILPRVWHITSSRAASAAFETRASALLIDPYCLWKYKDRYYWKKFEPGSSGLRYRSFQDFFTRNLLTPLEPKGDSAWPCEGLLCQVVPYRDMDALRIKGEWMRASKIFAIPESRCQVSGFMYNIFLHNDNYHHIHAPTTGRVTRILRIPGKLFFLRPWSHKDPSFPALKNERVLIDIEDTQGLTWCLAIVGGPMVGTVQLTPEVKVDARISICQKIASFRMGSTCCLLAPVRSATAVGSMVKVGDNIGQRE